MLALAGGKEGIRHTERRMENKKKPRDTPYAADSIVISESEYFNIQS